MKVREPLTPDELRTAHAQVAAVFLGSREDDITDAEFRAYGYAEGFIDVVQELTLDLLQGLPAGVRDLLEIEVATGCMAMACIVGQALNNREAGE